jgi:hypothetical protein
MEESTNRNCQRLYWCLGALILTLLAIGLGVASEFALNNGKAKQDPPDPASAEVRNPCDFTDQEQPDVHSQCVCFGRIQVIATDTLTSYKSILGTLGLIPGQNDIRSCEPENLSLLRLATQNANISGEVLRHCYVLNVLYLSLGGEDWVEHKGWLEANDGCTPCCFSGVTCDGETVIAIELEGNNLRGTLPSELSLLKSLSVLDVSSNSISGTLPSQFGRLTSLAQLLLGINNISGSIPSEVGLLSKLQALDLQRNKLVGPFPSELGMLTELQVLKAGDNFLEGKLPSNELSQLTKLIWFEMSPNLFYFNGPLPLWHLSSLTHISAAELNITGSIPASQLALMTDLIELHLDSNSITGTLPTELGLLTGLILLSVTSNRLTGTIPSSLGACSKLQSLYVGDNLISSSSTTEDLANLAAICGLRSPSGSLVDFEADCYMEVTCPAECCTSCTDESSSSSSGNYA